MFLMHRTNFKDLKNSDNHIPTVYERDTEWALGRCETTVGFGQNFCIDLGQLSVLDYHFPMTSLCPFPCWLKPLDPDLHYVGSTKTFCLLSKFAAERMVTCLAKRTPPSSETLMLLLEPKLTARDVLLLVYHLITKSQCWTVLFSVETPSWTFIYPKLSLPTL